MNSIAYDRIAKIDTHLCLANAMLKAFRGGDKRTYEMTDKQRSHVAAALAYTQRAMDRMQDIHEKVDND